MDHRPPPFFLHEGSFVNSPLPYPHPHPHINSNIPEGTFVNSPLPYPHRHLRNSNNPEGSFVNSPLTNHHRNNPEGSFVNPPFFDDNGRFESRVRVSPIPPIDRFDHYYYYCCPRVNDEEQHLIGLGEHRDDDRMRDDLRRDVFYNDWRSKNDFEREELLHFRIDKRRRIIDNLMREELHRNRPSGLVGRDELFRGDRFFDQRRDDVLPMGVARFDGFGERRSHVLGYNDGVRGVGIEGEERFPEFYGNRGVGIEGEERFPEFYGNRGVGIVGEERFPEFYGVRGVGSEGEERFPEFYGVRGVGSEGGERFPEFYGVRGVGSEGGERFPEFYGVQGVRSEGVERFPEFYGNRGVGIEGGERCPEFYGGGVDYGLYDDRGGREREGERERAMVRKSSPRKESAFCRLQPKTKGASTCRKKFDKIAPSSQKGKGVKVESSGHKSSEEKLESPVVLDVSFKSNALVAKATVCTPSRSGMDGNKIFGTGIVSGSPLKEPCLTSRGTNSTPGSKKKEKPLENLVNVSPILMKVGIRKVAEVPDDSSKPSSSGSSSLSGGGSTCCKLSSLSKDDKIDGLAKASLPNARKKRKAVNLISRFSTSMPTNSDTVVDGSRKASPEGVVLNKDDKIDGLRKTPLPTVVKKKKAVNLISRIFSAVPTNSDTVVHGLCQASLSKNGERDGLCKASREGEVLGENDKRDGLRKASLASVRKKKRAVMLISRLPTPLPTNSETVVDIDYAFNCPPGGSTSDAPRSLDTGCVQDDPRISSLIDDVIKPVEKCTDIDAKDSSGQNRVCGDYMEGSSEAVAVSICPHRISQDSLAATNSLACEVETSIMSENSAYAANSDVNVYEPCGLLRECNIIGQHFKDKHMNDGHADAGVRHSGDEMKLVCSPSIDVTNGDILSTDSMKITTISDFEVTNCIQEQQGTSAVSILADDGVTNRRKLSLKDSVSMKALSSIKENILSIDRKRKAGVEFCDPCTCSNKRKCVPLDSGFTDTYVSESCDICTPINASNSIASPPLDSVNHSEQAGGYELCNSLLPPVDVVVEATSTLPTFVGKLGDKSNSKVRHKDSHSSVEEIAQFSYMAESGCNKIVVDDLIGNRNGLGNELIGSDSDAELEILLRQSDVHCIRSSHDLESNDGPVVTNTECESNVIVESNLGTFSELTQEILTGKPGMSDKSSKVNPRRVLSRDTSTFENSRPAIDTTLDIICGNDEQKPMKSMRALISKSNLVCGGFQKNVIPGNSAAPSNQPFTQKGAFLPSKHVKKSVPVSSSTRRQFSWRNDQTQGKTILSSSQVSPVTTFSQKSVATLSAKPRSLYSSQASPITTFSKKSDATISAKPRTWHRTDNVAGSNANVKNPFPSVAPSMKKPSPSVAPPVKKPSPSVAPVKKPSPSVAPPKRPLYGNFLKVQDKSYIRKGNSLVRNTTSDTTVMGPRTLISSFSQATSIESGTTNTTQSPNRLIAVGRQAPIEKPKIPTSPCSQNSSDCNIAYMGNCTSPLQIERFEEMDNKVALKTTETASSLSGNPEIVLDRCSEDAGNLSDGVLQASNMKRVVYIKHKANQLIATSNSPDLSVSNQQHYPTSSRGLTNCAVRGNHMDKNLGLSSDNSSYYKRRKNQLIRASSESNIQKLGSQADDSSNSRKQMECSVYSGRSPSKRLSGRVKSLKVSLVWKLGDTKSSDKGSEPLRSRKLLSHLLPWKRTTYMRSMWRASSSSSICSSLIKTRKLLTSRNQAVLYKRSGRGFSLKRSKVVSLTGSLKWSKSMEKRSKKVDEEAAHAVAASDSSAGQKTEASGVSSKAVVKKLSSQKSFNGLKLHPGERIFRIGLFRYRMDSSRRTLQRIPDEEAPGPTTSKTEKYARKSYMPKRLLIGSDEYVRIGNGNQLVRDPKRRTRILANEKVRWSLHTARSRLAKKRKFCQFFTRFGRCNKSEGKCPYIHDSSKINVCTKFLKGLCVDPECKLTHKVIPDRMPDCSFFLQGLCSNGSCPYRHVAVDPKASICESFLRGYCAEGNECRKKHSYLCPEHEATGSCPQGSKCRLYHPKKGTSKKEKVTEDQRNIRGRYFDPGLTASIAKPENETAILEKDVARKYSGLVSRGDLGDYISLDVSDDEAGETTCPDNEMMYSPEFVALKNSSVLTGVELGDHMNLDGETEESKHLDSEVVYHLEFDVLSSLSDNVEG